MYDELKAEADNLNSSLLEGINLNMFENEIVLNEFQLKLLETIASDLPEEALFMPGQGHGHPPAWILGHLAIVGEMGQTFLGGDVTHTAWVQAFGPGSNDEVMPDSSLKRDSLIEANREAYATLRTLAANADPAAMAEPHQVELLKGSAIETNGQLLAHILTSHVGFHLAQLSSCRRELGQAALF